MSGSALMGSSRLVDASALGAHLEVPVGDVAVVARLTGQAEGPFSEHVELNLVGSPTDAGARAGQVHRLEVAAHGGVRSAEHQRRAHDAIAEVSRDLADA